MLISPQQENSFFFQAHKEEMARTATNKQKTLGIIIILISPIAAKNRE